MESDEFPKGRESTPSILPQGEYRKLDAVLDYLSFVAKSQPLSVLLDEAPKKIASAVDADVVSLYLLQGDGRTLVMRGNVGFPKTARGTVRLQVGEGITGMAVQARYPVASTWAPDHESYRDFPQLNEERFPAFLAVPIVGTSGALGAVVVQREGNRPFDEGEVSLIAALTAPISSAVRLVRLLDGLRDTAHGRAGSGTQKLTLPGVPLVGGKAMGAIAALRRPAATRGHSATPDRAAHERFEGALDLAERALATLIQTADELKLRDRTRFLDNYQVMLSDQRFRQRTSERLQRGDSLASAIGEVASEATRAAAKSGDPFLMSRARDMEQLCDALVMLATPDARASLPSKAVLLADDLSVYDLMISARAQPAGVVLTMPTAGVDDRLPLLLELLGVPAIADVQGAFRWVSPGDIALLDADHGFLIVNPSRAEVAAYRAERRRRRKSHA